MLVAAYELDGQRAVMSFAPQTRLESETEAEWIARMAALSLPPGTAFEVVERDAIAPTKDELFAYAERARAAHQTNGAAQGWEIDVAGENEPPLLVWVNTTQEGVVNVNGSVTWTLVNPSKTILWSQRSGAVELDAAHIRRMGEIVASFRQALYAERAAIYAGIEAGGVTTFAEIDAWEWPPVQPPAPAPQPPAPEPPAPAPEAPPPPEPNASEPEAPPAPEPPEPEPAPEPA